MEKILDKHGLISLFNTWAKLPLSSQSREINAYMIKLNISAYTENLLRKRYYEFKQFGETSLKDGYSITLD